MHVIVLASCGKFLSIAALSWYLVTLQFRNHTTLHEYCQSKSTHYCYCIRFSFKDLKVFVEHSAHYLLSRYAYSLTD